MLFFPFREKYEALLERDASGSVRHHDSDVMTRSLDSAIDSDLSEYHAETIRIDFVSKFSKYRSVKASISALDSTISTMFLQGSSEHLGFELGTSKEDSRVIVSHVTQGTPAANKLR